MKRQLALLDHALGGLRRRRAKSAALAAGLALVVGLLSIAKCAKTLKTTHFTRNPPLGNRHAQVAPKTNSREGFSRLRKCKQR